jgi:hypothetical protein
MKTFAISAILSVAALAENRKIDPSQPCRIRGERAEPRIITPLEPMSDLPDSMLWNDVNGRNFLTNIRN